jgi:hypothetical protein
MLRKNIIKTSILRHLRANQVIPNCETYTNSNNEKRSIWGAYLMGGSLLAFMMLKPAMAQTEEQKSSLPSFLPKLEIPELENKKA